MKTWLHFFLLLVTLWVSIIIIIIPLVHSKCIPDQQQSLLDFKSSLLFNSSLSSKLITWNSSTDCCSWVGVTCSTNGHVLGIDLNNESISGGIDNSSSLFHLQNLQSLNLADNKLGNGSLSIPSAVGQLMNLRLLAKFRHDSEEEEARRLANEAAIVAAAAGYEIECSDQPRQRGSRPGRAPNVERLRESRGKDLMEDYFVERPVFPDLDFRQRYRMHRPLFESILTAVTQYDDYFIQKADALGVLGLSPHQKLTCALRMLAYGAGANQCAEITRMGDSTALKSLKRFCRAIEGIYTSYYLRSPTPEDLRRLLKKARRRGFPGMLGSIDCMHWQWKNCPTAWAGAYSGRKGYPTIILEAVASYDTYIWHAFFGVPGSCNDLNVLGQSPVFNDLTAGVAPRFKYKVNQKDFDMGYYLADGIYPKWHTFVKTIPRPTNEMQQHFSKKQEGYRKDVERCFGILQARFAILRGGARLFKKETLRSVMMTCIILHNMIVEDERIDDESDLECDVDGIDSMSLDVVEEYEQPRNALPFEPVRVGVNGDNLPGFMDRYDLVRDEYVHQILQENLVEHNWKIKTGGA